MIPTGRQIREGRALAGMSQAELAAVAEVAVELVIRAEATDGMPKAPKRVSNAIRRALEAAGVTFIAENGEGPGVGLRRSSATPPSTELGA